MMKSALLALSLTASSFALTFSASAETPAATAAPAPVDPVRLKLAEQTVAKLIPPGTYQKIMEDTMAGGMIDQMMGIDAATMAGMAGVEADSEAAEAAKGKTMAEIMAEMDPNFKERMDIMAKVIFSEMGPLMSAIEPTVREALAKIYARKYSAQELADMNSFFATPSGAAFAGNFMATFTDKEMMDASMGMMPKIVEAMPAIMKKVEAATAHLPPPPKSDSELAIEAADTEFTDALDAEETGEDPYAEETGDEPWYAEGAWTETERKKVKALEAKYDAADSKMEVASANFEALVELSSTASDAYYAARQTAIDAARKRMLAEGWTPPPAPSETTEDSASAEVAE
ncbi:DUF2059 domain-containing protein [Sphingorhabdus sp.]|uniref:DUF2059 domain-containing protein n=1 Tax=Sphingorhabdus sp. TaxID=1902408 RepID=UPI003593E515